MKNKFYEYRGEGTGHGDIVKTSDDINGIIVKSSDYQLVGIEVELKMNKSNDLYLLSNEEMISRGLSHLYDLDQFIRDSKEESVRGDGGLVDYYKLPENATQLSHLIYHKKMNHSIGEAFCALYRLNDNGERERNIRKVIRYMELELEQC